MGVPRDHEERQNKNALVKEVWTHVHEQKRKAALRNPGSDRSKEKCRPCPARRVGKQ